MTFFLDADKCWRLTHDANQWIIERRGTARRTQFEGGHSAIYRWEGKWHVGAEKRTLRQYISGERPPLAERPRISLTTEANHRLHMLPDTFCEFQTMAVPSTMAA